MWAFSDGQIHAKMHQPKSEHFISWHWETSVLACYFSFHWLNYSAITLSFLFVFFCKHNMTQLFRQIISLLQHSGINVFYPKLASLRVFLHLENSPDLFTFDTSCIIKTCQQVGIHRHVEMKWKVSNILSAASSFYFSVLGGTKLKSMSVWNFCI